MKSISVLKLIIYELFLFLEKSATKNPSSRTGGFSGGVFFTEQKQPSITLFSALEPSFSYYSLLQLITILLFNQKGMI